MDKKKPERSDCRPDPNRMAVFKDCIATYGMDHKAPESEWPWNVLAKSTVAYSCGWLGIKGHAFEHHHDSNEIALCRTLAKEACKVMKNCHVGMGSNSGDPFRPYFAAANIGTKAPKNVNAALIRQVFSGTIYPPTQIVIEPLEENGDWWKQVVEDGSGDEGYLQPWREMVKWFRAQKDLHKPAFVQIGDDPLESYQGKWNGGCVFPRLAVAITPQGSLVGIGGWVVHS